MTHVCKWSLSVSGSIVSICYCGNPCDDVESRRAGNACLQVIAVSIRNEVSVYCRDVPRSGSVVRRIDDAHMQAIDFSTGKNFWLPCSYEHAEACCADHTYLPVQSQCRQVVPMINLSVKQMINSSSRKWSISEAAGDQFQIKLIGLAESVLHTSESSHDQLMWLNDTDSLSGYVCMPKKVELTSLCDPTAPNQL